MPTPSPGFTPCAEPLSPVQKEPPAGGSRRIAAVGRSQETLASDLLDKATEIPGSTSL